MDNKSFSRYRNIESIIHKIDPITKLICFLLLSLTMFLAQINPDLELPWLPFAVMGGTVILIAILARVRVKTYFNLIIVVMPFFFVMFILYGLFMWGNINDVLQLVIPMTIRLYLFLMIAVIFTSTTKEMEIARSVEWLISPLRLIKVPTYEIAMMITLALRFIPILINDLFMIMRAQTSRGINVVNGSFSTRIKGVFSSLLPMFVIAFRRADDLSVAMSTRQYETNKKRTKYWTNKFFILEWIALVVVLTLFISIILINAGVIA